MQADISVWLADMTLCVTNCALRSHLIQGTTALHKDSLERCMSWGLNVFIAKRMEKLVLRCDKAPAEVSLINYDEAMQIVPGAAGSPACTVQLACH